MTNVKDLKTEIVDLYITKKCSDKDSFNYTRFYYKNKIPVTGYIYDNWQERLGWNPSLDWGPYVVSEVKDGYIIETKAYKSLPSFNPLAKALYD